MGQTYPLLIQLVITILVVELNDIVKSQIIDSYTKKGLIMACRSQYQAYRYIPGIVLRSFTCTRKSEDSRHAKTTKDERHKKCEYNTIYGVINLLRNRQARFKSNRNRQTGVLELYYWEWSAWSIQNRQSLKLKCVHGAEFGVSCQLACRMRNMRMEARTLICITGIQLGLFQQWFRQPACTPVDLNRSSLPPSYYCLMT